MRTGLTGLLIIFGLALGLAGGYHYRDHAVRHAISEAQAAIYDAERKLEHKDPTRCSAQREALTNAFEKCFLGNENLKTETQDCDDARAAGTFKYKPKPKAKQPRGGTR